MKKYLFLFCVLAFVSCETDDGPANYSDGNPPEQDADEVLTGDENIKFIDDNFGGTLEMIDADETKAAFAALKVVFDKNKRNNGEYQIEASGTGRKLVFEGETIGRLELWENTKASASKNGKVVISADLQLAIGNDETYFNFLSGSATASGTVWFGKQTMTLGVVGLTRKTRLLRKEFHFVIRDMKLYVDGTEEAIVYGEGTADGDVAWQYSVPEEVSLHLERPGVIATDASYTDLLANKHRIVVMYNGKPKIRAKIHFYHIMRTILSYVAPSQLSFLTDTGDDGIGYMAFYDEDWKERPLEETFNEDNFPRSFPAAMRFL